MNKTVLYSLVILLFISAVVFFMISLQIEYTKNSYFKENFDNKNYFDIYEFYFNGNPLAGQRPIIGGDRDLTMIAVIDLTSDDTRKFYDSQLAQVKSNYVDGGQASLSFKYFLTSEDIDSQTGKFIKSKAAYCYYSDLGEVGFFDFQRALIDEQGSLISVSILAIQRGATPAFGECMTNNNFETLREDATESERFLIQSPSLIIGIKNSDMDSLLGQISEAQISQVIRQKQVSIGI